MMILINFQLLYIVVLLQNHRSNRVIFKFWYDSEILDEMEMGINFWFDLGNIQSPGIPFLASAGWQCFHF